MTNIIFAIVIGYLFGCIQPSYIIGRLIGGIDIRKHGTNNAGASNVTTVLGWRYGLLVAIIDIAKGFWAVRTFADLFSERVELLYLTGFMVIIGHIFPMFMKFKGGKGAAAFIGIVLAINPVFGLINIGLITLVTLLTDYIALGTIAMYFGMVLYCIFTEVPPIVVFLSMGMLVLILFKHRINLTRMRDGTEIGLRANLNKNKEG